MIIKYRTGGFGKDPIERVEVERETEHCIWVNGSRQKKYSSWYKYFDSWCAAHAHILGKAERSLAVAHVSLEKAQDELAAIRAISEPKQCP